jgi:hypothetical protein
MIIAPADAPLIALPALIDGQEVVLYYTSHEEADAYFGPKALDAALDAAGAWSDLDWEGMRSGLERIRKESGPRRP